MENLPNHSSYALVNPLNWRIMGVMKNLKYKVICVECNKEINCSQPNQKVCSNDCRKTYYGKNRPNNVNQELNTGTIGAITELKVASYLMEKGYTVFRALSPAAFCDLIALKHEENMYVEVRTGYISHKGNLGYIKRINIGNGKPTHFAVYTYLDNKVNIIKI